MIANNNVNTKMNPAKVSKQKLIEIFQTLDQAIETNHSTVKGEGDQSPNNPRFLFDTKLPTAADIALASFAFPVIFPPEISHLFASKDEFREIIDTYTKNADKSKSIEEIQGLVELHEFSNYLLATFESARLVNHLYSKYRYYPSEFSINTTA
jgi:hypothetical protein